MADHQDHQDSQMANSGLQNSSDPQTLPPHPRSDINWHQKGVACSSCASSRWLDCDKDRVEGRRCTNCRYYGGKCDCQFIYAKSWADIMIAEATATLKRSSTQMSAPKLRQVKPSADVVPADVPAVAVQPPPIPQMILNDAFAAFGRPRPTAEDLQQRAHKTARNTRYQKPQPAGRGYAATQPAGRGYAAPQPAYAQTGGSNIAIDFRDQTTGAHLGSFAFTSPAQQQYQYPQAMPGTPRWHAAQPQRYGSHGGSFGNPDAIPPASPGHSSTSSWAGSPGTTLPFPRFGQFPATGLTHALPPRPDERRQNVLPPPKRRNVRSEEEQRSGKNDLEKTIGEVAVEQGYQTSTASPSVHGAGDPSAHAEAQSLRKQAEDARKSLAAAMAGLDHLRQDPPRQILSPRDIALRAQQETQPALESLRRTFGPATMNTSRAETPPVVTQEQIDRIVAENPDDADTDDLVAQLMTVQSGVEQPPVAPQEDDAMVVDSIVPAADNVGTPQNDESDSDEEVDENAITATAPVKANAHAGMKRSL